MFDVVYTLKPLTFLACWGRNDSTDRPGFFQLCPLRRCESDWRFSFRAFNVGEKNIFLLLRLLVFVGFRQLRLSRDEGLGQLNRSM